MTQYKTAAELGITEEERTALILTKQVLRAEQVILDMGTQCDVRTEDGSGDISTVPLPACRTKLCIGGTMKLLMLNDMQLPVVVTPEMGDKIVKYVDRVGERHSELGPLFWDRTDHDISPADGLKAINRFLAGNTDDPWLLNVD